MKQDSIRIAADSQARFNNNTAFCIGTGRMGLALQQEYQQPLATHWLSVRPVLRPL